MRCAGMAQFRRTPMSLWRCPLAHATLVRTLARPARALQPHAHLSAPRYRLAAHAVSGRGRIATHRSMHTSTACCLPSPASTGFPSSDASTCPSAVSLAAASASSAAALPAGWVRCFVAIGSNAGHRARHIHAALALLQQMDPLHIQLHATSCLYESSPVGSPPEHASQARFLNGVLELRTSLPPLQLLDQLKEVERRMGRDAHMVRNGPRVIDLDILFYDSPTFSFQHPRLEVPHPRWFNRGFVLVPLQDLLTPLHDEPLSAEHAAWAHMVEQATAKWKRTQAQLWEETAGSAPELECIYRVIAFPNAECVPDSASAALSDVWRWGAQLGVQGTSPSDAPFPQAVGAPTVLMGILNVTPDSFSDGGVHMSHGVQGAVEAAKRMWDQGADIIDVGGESTRPGSLALTASEERERIMPVIDAIHAQYPLIKLSVDTYHPSVAREAVLRGCVMINDVYGGTYREESAAGDARAGESMLDVAASLNVPYVCMHMRGTVQTMAAKEYTAYNDVVSEVRAEQSSQIRAALRTRAPLLPLHAPASSSPPAAASPAVSSPLYRWNVIADPGVGFAKHGTHALQLLHSLPGVRPGPFPVLVGTSRKGFISRLLSHGQQQVQLRHGADVSAAYTRADDTSATTAATPTAKSADPTPAPAAPVSPADREWGTGATVVASILGGADIVRIHDVQAMRCLRDVADAIGKR